MGDNCYSSDSRINKKESLAVSTPTLETKSDSLLKEINSESNLPIIYKQNSRTRMSSDIPGSPKTQLKTLNIQQDNLNMEIKVTSTEDIRVEIEIGEQDGEIKKNILESPKIDCGLRDKSKKTLKQLGKFYSGKHNYILLPTKLIYLFIR